MEIITTFGDSKMEKNILARFPRGDPELLNPREEDPLEAKQAFVKEKP